MVWVNIVEALWDVKCLLSRAVKLINFFLDGGLYVVRRLPGKVVVEERGNCLCWSFSPVFS